MDVEIGQTSRDSQMSLNQDIQEPKIETSQGTGSDAETVASQLGCETSISNEAMNQEEKASYSSPETHTSLQQEQDTFIACKETDEDICKETKVQTSTCWSQEGNELSEPEEYGFPDSLEGFKYAFNKCGQLRHLETMAPFKFDVKKDDMRYNQLHYEALGEVLSEYIYGLLQSETNLSKVYLGDPEDDPRSFVFMSENALTTTNKLLILIHGSGVVRAGQWARRLVINDCLDSGTQLPYIKKAREEGYEVLVMNTNHNYAMSSDGQRIPIKGSCTPQQHGLHVWDQFVSETPAKHVAVVAHSYGGIVTVELAVQRMESFRRKVFAVAFTDSIHTLHYDRIGEELRRWFVNNAVNWVSSDVDLDTVIADRGFDCKKISAGTSKHEETSWYSLQSIFQFLRVKEQSLKDTNQKNIPSETSETKECIAEVTEVAEEKISTDLEEEEQDTNIDIEERDRDPIAMV